MTILKTLNRKQLFVRGVLYLPDMESLTVISDNGPQFSCREFEKFATGLEFEHVTSSPIYPQSTRKVEQAVKSAKRLMKRARKNNKDIYLAILDFCNTPTEGMSSSPVQRLMKNKNTVTNNAVSSNTKIT